MTWLGIGTHLLGQESCESLKLGIGNGIKAIDTAPNYGKGHAHSIIKDATSEIQSSVDIYTKVGFLPSGILNNETQEIISDDSSVANGNVLDENYVYAQGVKNIEDLGVNRLKCLFLHNPELHLTNYSKRKFLAKIARCFESCELLCENNLYEYYGIATWSGLFDVITCSDLSSLAQDIRGDRHKFRFIQTPVSLVRLEHIIDWIKGRPSLLRESKDLGISVIASSPLHTGELMPMLSKELISLIADKHEIQSLSSAQIAIQFVRSAPSIDGVFVTVRSTSSCVQLIELKNMPPLDFSTIRNIVNMLG